MLALLKDRTFLLLEARGTAANVGYSVYLGTVLWLSFELTGGIFLAGIVVGLETAVYALTFLAGPLVDRVLDKRSVYLIAYPIQAGAALGLGVAYLAHALTVPLLLLLVVLLAVLWDFTWAADMAATRLLFGSDRLFAVSGLGTALGGAADVAMYLLAGLTLAVLGIAGGSLLYASLLGAGAVAAAFLAIPTPRAFRGTYAQALSQGWSMYRGPSGRPLRHLAAFQLVFGFFTPAPLLLLTLLVGAGLAGSQGAFATLYVAYLVGGIVVGLVLGHANPRKRVGALAVAGLAGLGLALGAAALAVGDLPLGLVLWGVIGGAATARTTAVALFVQGRFAPEMLGRLSANNYVFNGVAGAAGAVAFGELSTVLTPLSLTWIAVVGLLAAAGFGLALPEMRRLAF